MKKIIASSVLATIAVSWVTGLSVSADEEKNTDSKKSFGFEKMFDRGGDERWERGSKMVKIMWKMFLTETEKESVKNMTRSERKKFMDAKKEAFKNMSDEEKNALKEKIKVERDAHIAERQAKSQVIDDLLAWKTLTSEQETLRTEIIKERAERKAEKLKRQEKMEAVKSIFEKKKAGEKLTDEEKTTLNEFKSKKRWGHRGENRREHR